MKRRVQFLCVAITLLCYFSPVNVSAQTVSNVSVQQEGNNIVVSYLLDGDSNDVQLTVSTDGGKTFSGPLKCVSGDVGSVSSGHRKIVWDVLEERENLMGNDIVFNVTATSRYEVNGYEYVDMGLSVKWATCNIGASRPEEKGRFFAWCDVVGQAWIDAEKRWSGSQFYYNGGKGNYDFSKKKVNSKGMLNLDYDAAHCLLGGSWRMPSVDECNELIRNCTVEWVNDYKGTGVSGRIFTSKKPGYRDKSIFLPAAGDGQEIYNFNTNQGLYWSRNGDKSTFDREGKHAWVLQSHPEVLHVMSRDVTTGMPIRPVLE